MAGGTILREVIRKMNGYRAMTIGFSWMKTGIWSQAGEKSEETGIILMISERCCPTRLHQTDIR